MKKQVLLKILKVLFGCLIYFGLILLINCLLAVNDVDYKPYIIIMTIINLVGIGIIYYIFKKKKEYAIGLSIGFLLAIIYSFSQLLIIIPRDSSFCRSSFGEGYHTTEVTKDDNSKVWACCPKDIKNKVKYSEEIEIKCVFINK